MKIFVYSIISIVAVAIIAGFFIVGSPKEERLRRFDEVRIENLRFLQGEIVNYWQQKSRLPVALSDLRDDIRGITIPADPETGVTYQYETKSNVSFSLCATFNRPSLSENIPVSKVARPVPAPMTAPEGYYAGEDNWTHGSGNVCFTRTIDTERYKPFPKT